MRNYSSWHFLCSIVPVVWCNLFGYVVILAVCMTSYSWANIRWAFGFDIKTGCDTKCGHSFWRRCILMSSTTYPKFSSRGDARGLEYSSHQSLLPILDLTNALPGKSICVPVNSVSILMIRSYHNVFPDVSYILPKGFLKMHPDAPRNVCGVRTADGWLCCFHTTRSPIQVTIHQNHHVFAMFYITAILEFKPFLDSFLQSSRICEYFPTCLRTLQIESAQPKS
jgi:hypothetical protein